MNETVAMSSFVIINSINVTQVEDALNEAYDRSCDLHPFLNNLRKKGNVGAKIILEHVKFLVDIFHVLKHKEECCMPPDNQEIINQKNKKSKEQTKNQLNNVIDFLTDFTEHVCNRGIPVVCHRNS